LCGELHQHQQRPFGAGKAGAVPARAARRLERAELARLKFDKATHAYQSAVDRFNSFYFEDKVGGLRSADGHFRSLGGISLNKL
jgi:hypothetical protein